MIGKATIRRRFSRALGIAVVVALVTECETVAGQEAINTARHWQLNLRYRTETSPSSRHFHTLTRPSTWEAKKTALIVCDVWDAHHSVNATRRVEELAPRIDDLVRRARQCGATIIHAPSDCMESYANHPSRKRAQSTPKAAQIPTGMESWCHRIDSEESIVYPLDQSDGGEDDDPSEHAAWSQELQAKGRNPGNPWQTQSPLIAIDEDRDFISDNGQEVWSILESRGIQNVILVGVHTNMCVLGRPFGLRNMVAAGKQVVLVRDLTDTMYNPQRWPFVNHFTGTDLIIEYIEKCVCPTITSDQLVGGSSFRFKSDSRPLVAIMMAEDEYETNQTLPKFAADHLGKDFRIALLFSSNDKPNEIPGLEIINEADAVIFSVRRRPLPLQQMEIIRRYAESGKAIIGIRTASHAFVLREAVTPKHLDAWPEFDAQVFGGNYTGHHGNALLPMIRIEPENADHPILTGISKSRFSAGGSLYKTSPLAKSAKVLLVGTIESQPAEPVAWVYKRASGGSSFYTSLGHKQDFENQEFVHLLLNSLHWATGRAVQDSANRETKTDSAAGHWEVINIPIQRSPETSVPPSQGSGDGWYRCFFKLGTAAVHSKVRLKLPTGTGVSVWVNGNQLSIDTSGIDSETIKVPDAFVEFGELNLLVIRCAHTAAVNSWTTAPRLLLGDRRLSLSGKWQFRSGIDPTFATLKLPPKFGAAPDIIFESTTTSHQ